MRQVALKGPDPSTSQAITLVLDSSGTSTQTFSPTSSPIFRLVPTFNLFWTASGRDSTQRFTLGALKNIKIYPYDVRKKCVRRRMSGLLQIYGVDRRVDQLAQVQAELGALEVFHFPEYVFNCLWHNFLPLQRAAIVVLPRLGDPLACFP